MKILASPAFKTRDSNPYPWLLYSNMNATVAELSWDLSRRQNADIIHLHWPDWDLNASRNPFVVMSRLLWKLTVIDRLRANGSKLVWTVHNVKSHEGFHPQLEKWFWRHFLGRVDGIIALTELGRELVCKQHPALASVPQFVVPHGHYRDEYPNNRISDARSELGIKSESKVLLFFGGIRSYKNVPHLLKEFRRLEGANYILYVAGNCPEPDLTSELQDLATKDHRIHLCLEFIPKDRVQLYFRAADLVVLPYQEILNSGTAILSLSLNRPVLIPNLGSMGELVNQIGGAWVRTYEGALTANELQTAIEWATKTTRPDIAPLENLEWPAISAKTLEVFNYLCERRPL